MKTTFTLLLTLLTALTFATDCNKGTFISFTDSIDGSHVYFADNSKAPNSYLIRKTAVLGDDSLPTTYIMPVHVYMAEGSHNPCLSKKSTRYINAEEALYCTDSVCRTIYIQAEDPNATVRGLAIAPNPSSGNFKVVGDIGIVKAVHIINANGDILLTTTDIHSAIQVPERDNSQILFVRIDTDRGFITKLLRMEN